MKHLKIQYTKDNGKTVTLFDDEVNEVVWNDTDNGVRVEGRIRGAGGAGLLDLLTQASKQRTEAVAEEKRAAAAEEPPRARKAAARKAAARPEVAEQDG